MAKKYVSIKIFSIDSNLPDCCIRRFIKQGMPVYPSGRILRVVAEECDAWISQHVRRTAGNPVIQDMWKQIEADQKSRERREN